MKASDIKRYLQVYSISKKRSSTINNAFASALSVADNFVIDDVNNAIKLLGQDPKKELKCVYCDLSASTWDHINAIVAKGEFSGYGHQLNNLVPCCKDCNSAKGNKNWEIFLRIKNPKNLRKKISIINKYLKNNNVTDIKKRLNSKAIKDDYIKYMEIKDKVIKLLEKADKHAEVIREKLKSISK
jgi:hypothetical protein